MKKTFLVLISFLISKFLLSSLIPLIGDEAYYWVWSQRMQLSYFDHPPFVSWLFWLSQWGSSFLGPRWVSLILSVGTLGFWLLLSKRSLKSEPQVFLFLILLSVSPMIGFGSLLVTPDVPLFFFWSLSTLLLLEIIEKQRALDYALLGFALGLGFCSKYHIVLWPTGALVFLIVSGQWSLVQWKKLMLTFIFGLLACLPVLYWNFQNNWASFKFQIEHGFSQGPWDWRWTADYLVGQVVLLAPVPFFRAAYKFKAVNLTLLMHLCLGWIPLGFFLFSSFRGPVEANWPMMSLAHLGLAVFCYHDSSAWKKYYIGFWSFLSATALFCILVPKYNFLHPKLSEPKKYSDSIAIISNYRPLYASTYQMASSIWYFSKVPTFKLAGESRYDYFDQMPESTPSSIPFYYLKENYQELPARLLSQGYQFKEVSRPFLEHTLFEVTK